jgi:hypothetical protein
MFTAFKRLDELLRGRLTSPEGLADGRLKLSLRLFVPLATFLGISYGFFMLPRWAGYSGRSSEIPGCGLPSFGPSRSVTPTSSCSTYSAVHNDFIRAPSANAGFPPHRKDNPALAFRAMKGVPALWMTVQSGPGAR